MLRQPHNSTALTAASASGLSISTMRSSTISACLVNALGNPRGLLQLERSIHHNRSQSTGKMPINMAIEKPKQVLSSAELYPR